jgi:hypothetical protein
MKDDSKITPDFVKRLVHGPAIGEEQVYLQVRVNEVHLYTKDPPRVDLSVDIVDKEGRPLVNVLSQAMVTPGGTLRLDGVHRVFEFTIK